MPGSRGRRPSRPLTPEKLAEWERGAFSALRRHRDLPTPIDDALPEDAMPGDPATRSALDDLAQP